MEKSTFNISTLALTTLLISFGITGFAYADEEALGQTAEVEGKLRQALTHYVEALKTDATNQQLRVKIIKLAQKIQPPPRVPEQAERYLARGEAAVESAQDDHGFNLAVDEFTSALQIAPWVADIYFNLGVVLDKAGQYDAAISNLNLYLIAMPHDKDAKKLKYKIEFRQEAAQREKVHKQKNSLNFMSGNWSSSRWYRPSETPSIDGKYWTKYNSKYGFKVRINGETFHAVLKDTINTSYIFNGHIIEGVVSGTVTYTNSEPWRCPAYPDRTFKASILTKEMMIYLSFKGEYIWDGFSCSLDDWNDSALTSYRFTR